MKFFRFSIYRMEFPSMNADGCPRPRSFNPEP